MQLTWARSISLLGLLDSGLSARIRRGRSWHYSIQRLQISFGIDGIALRSWRTVLLRRLNDQTTTCLITLNFLLNWLTLSQEKLSDKPKQVKQHENKFRPGLRPKLRWGSLRTQNGRRVEAVPDYLCGKSGKSGKCHGPRASEGPQEIEKIVPNGDQLFLANAHFQS